MKEQNALHDFLGDFLVVVRRMRKRPGTRHLTPSTVVCLFQIRESSTRVCTASHKGFIHLRSDNLWFAFKAPFKEEVEALRVTLSREERLLQVLANEIATVQKEHDHASHNLAQAQAALDAAQVIYRTSETMLQGLEAQHEQLLQNVAEKKATLHPIRRVYALERLL